MPNCQKSQGFRRLLIPGTLFVLVLAISCPAVYAAGVFETQADQDAILKNVRVDERPGAQAPLDLVFTDQQGRQVRLGDYFKGMPVVLTLNYYECPMLCPIIFSNFAGTIGEMKGLVPGKDYRVVTVSINPDETGQTTSDKARESYALLKGEDNPAGWWAFLYGNALEINTLADSVGYRYVKIGPDNFAHPSVIVVLTPSGKVSRYLYGIKQEPMDLRLALTEAADGRVGASRALNQVLLFCYHYDPVGRKYQLAATRLMKVGGALTLLFLGVLAFFMWRHESGRG